MTENRLHALHSNLPTVAGTAWEKELVVAAVRDALRRTSHVSKAIIPLECVEFVLDLKGSLGYDTFPLDLFVEIDSWLVKNWNYSSLRYYDDIASLTVLVSNELNDAGSVRKLLEDKHHHSIEIRKIASECIKEFKPQFKRSD